MAGEVSDKDLYDAVLELTGDEDVASAAYTARIQYKMKEGMKVEV